MKFRIGAVLLATLLAGCGGSGSDSWQAGLRGTATPGQPSGKASASPVPVRMAGVSIADAPDRGKLVSYPQGAPAQQKGAFTWYPVSVSEEHAFNAIASGEMTFPAPDGTQIRLRYERHAEQLDGNWTWVGRVVGGDPRQEAIITFGEQAVFGSIPQENGPPLSLQTRQGALWVVKMDPSKAAKPGIRGDAKVPRAAANAVRDTTATAEAAPIALSGMVTALRAPQTDANTIDAAIGYTAGFASYYGGTSQATTRLAYLIEVGNQAFNNSNVDGYLRLVRTLQVSYTDANANETALDALTGTDGTQSVPIPSSLVPLRTARDQYSADIAILVRKFTTPENDGCGIAWLIGADQTPITNGDAAYAYAVVSDGTDQGTDGFSYYCDDNTLSHESAHLMGSAHDRANAQGDNGQLQYGRYPYSFGLKTSAANGNFYTIMAYGDPDQMPYRVFSNPRITFCGDRACGVTNSEDNARSLNQTIPVLAQFRASVSPISEVRGPADFDGDGRNDILWRHAVTGANSIWKSANRNTSQTVAAVTDINWRVAGVGDFDGDGRSDILWRHAVTGANSIWKSANRNTSQTVAAVTDINWRVAGVGDFDGDGRSDILWRHAVTGANSIWKSANRNTPQTVSTVADTSWNVYS
ncbi:reprolysin-like metallopeptidase [Pseudoxanthomonas sangjuensis]|uniref:reprolysin-like metallopeptidase n=1 Tax=Pseudoxanthomonas sangjuensis TaxID=1503750 RepID=UPI001390D025|nr:M12 family metallo-peptidase [Pseudoxanthomonas sangjuensis]